MMFRGGRMNVLIDGQAELTDAQYVSGEFFPGLAIPPGAGRLLVADDDRKNAQPVAVVSAGYAARRLGSITNAVGKQIRINNAPFTIVGVTPEGFEGVEPGAAKSLYVPMQTIDVITGGDGPSFTDPNYYWAEIMGRLRPGVTSEQANAALSAAFAQWVAATATNDAERANLPVLTVGDGGGGLDTLRRRYERPLYLLQAIVGLILAIACANTANLLLARSAARQREIAVRLSIGAGRFRLVRQLLTESLVLAVVSGTAGILLAIAGTRVLSALLANGDEGLLLQAGVNWTVLAVTLGLSLSCGLIFGLAPAIQATRPELVPALKDTGGHVGGKVSRYRMPRLKLQQGLVVTQIALLMLLLVGAGLFARTLSKLQAIPLGFNPERLLLFDINAPQAGYPEAGAAAYYTQLRDRFVEIPGVRAATLSHASLIKAGRGHPVGLDGVRLEGTNRLMQTGPRFFSTMQISAAGGSGVRRARPGRGRRSGGGQRSVRAHLLPGPESHRAPPDDRRRHADGSRDHRRLGAGALWSDQVRIASGPLRVVFPGAALVAAVDDLCAEDRRRSSELHSRRPANRARRRLADSGHQLQDPDRRDRLDDQSGNPARAHLHRLRHRGAGHRLRRALRHDGLRGGAADEGDRHSHRHWRAAPLGDLDGGSRGLRAGGAGPADQRAAGQGAVDIRAVVPVRHAAQRSPSDRRGTDGAVRGGRAGRLPAGAAGLTHRSGDGASSRVMSPFRTAAGARQGDELAGRSRPAGMRVRVARHRVRTIAIDRRAERSYPAAC
jgi:hypothetical protein